MHNIRMSAVYNAQCQTSTESAQWAWKENLSFLGYCTMLNGKLADYLGECTVSET
jgi:hypothetical protein